MRTVVPIVKSQENWLILFLGSLAVYFFIKTFNYRPAAALFPRICPELDGNLEGGFNGRSTITGKEGMPQMPRRYLRQSLRQGDGVGVGHAAEDGVLELARLMLNGLDQLRMPVAQVDAPPRGNSIE